jgi:iron complex outermembrane receptor protein
MQSFFSVTRKSSDGYIANTDFDIKNIFSQSILNTKSAGKFGLQLAYQKKSYGANGFYSLAYPNQFDHTKTIYGALDWKQTISAKVNLTAQLYSRRHYDRFELFRDMENAASWYKGHNYHLTDVKGARAVLALLTQYGNFQLGADVRNEHIYSTVLGNALNEAVQNKFDKDIYFTKASQRFLPGFFADYALSVKSLFLSAGFSHTFSSQFGDFTAGGFEVAYHFTDNFKVFVLANSAVRLPTFTDLYYKSATQNANPDLRPEHARTIELGTKFEKKNMKFSGALFYRMGGNVIDWVKEPDSTRWESRNLTEVNVFGIDFSTEYRFHTSFLKKMALSYSFLTMDKSAGSYDSKYALDYLKNKLILSADHNLYKSLYASWKLSYIDRAGDYTDFKTGEKIKYAPYFMADVRLQWSKASYDLYLDLNNVADVQYADFGGLTQPGRNFMAWCVVSTQ